MILTNKTAVKSGHPPSQLLNKMLLTAAATTTPHTINTHPHHLHTTPKTKRPPWVPSQLGMEMLILDTTLSYELRNKLGIRGVMPPAVDTPDIQIERCLARIRAKSTNLDKYVLPQCRELTSFSDTSILQIFARPTCTCSTNCLCRIFRYSTSRELAY